MNRSIEIGDKIRFSVVLLKQIYEEPAHLSVALRLIDVELEPDGTKILTVSRMQNHVATGVGFES